MVRQPFKPLVNHKSKILILGSFPSVKSRKEDFYYMHPKNRFWQILSHLFYEDFVHADVQEKTMYLNKHHIALYDVVEVCEINGSKDATIVAIEIADIPKIIKQTEIEKVFLNGRKAESLFKLNFPHLKAMAQYLPSTSPANAGYSLERLLKAWKQIKLLDTN